MTEHAALHRSATSRAAQEAQAGRPGTPALAQLAADLNAGPKDRAFQTLAHARPFQAKGVVQRWQSNSLARELNTGRIAGLRGLAMMQAEEAGEERDDYADDDELAPHLVPADADELGHLTAVQNLERQGLAGTVHHILPRNQIRWLYENIPAEARGFLTSMFGRREGLGGFHGDNDAASREVLLSLRSNLALGPEPGQRRDDPREGFDPNFAAPGVMDATSQIYRQIDQLITAARAGAPIDINLITNLLLDAEIGFAGQQGHGNFLQNRIDTAHVAGNWQGRNLGRVGQEYWKTNSPDAG